MSAADDNCRRRVVEDEEDQEEVKYVQVQVEMAEKNQKATNSNSEKSPTIQTVSILKVEHLDESGRIQTEVIELENFVDDEGEEEEEDGDADADDLNHNNDPHPDSSDNNNDDNDPDFSETDADADADADADKSVSKKVAELDKFKKIWLVESYCLHKNTGLVIKAWREKFPQIKPPHRSTILRLLKKFQEYGSIERKKYIRKNPVRTEANIAKVKEYFDANPNISTRKAAPILEIERTTLRRVLTDLKKSKSKTTTSRSANRKKKHATKITKPSSVVSPRIPVIPAAVDPSTASTFPTVTASSAAMSLPPP